MDEFVLGVRTICSAAPSRDSTPPAVIVRIGTFFHATVRFCDALMIPSLRR